MENVKENMQEVAPDITLHWLHDHQIAYFTTRTVARTSWDGWLDTMLKMKREWPQDRPFLNLQDNLYQGAAFTPTVRQHSIQVSRYRPEIVQCTAVVLPKTIVAQFVQLFMRTFHEPNVDARVFFTVEDGLAWLVSKLGTVQKA